MNFKSELENFQKQLMKLVMELGEFPLIVRNLVLSCIGKLSPEN